MIGQAQLKNYITLPIVTPTNRKQKYHHKPDSSLFIIRIFLWALDPGLDISNKKTCTSWISHSTKALFLFHLCHLRAQLSNLRVW